MANTLTGLVPDLYAAVDVVSRELAGLIPAVTLDANAARAAVGQDVLIPVAPAAAASDITPGTTPPDDGDQSIGNTSITVSKSRTVPFRWTGEEQRGIGNGPGYQNIRRDQIAQAIRTLVNEVEADLAALYFRSSRAYGTAGTSPFGSSLGDSAQVLKMLLDNGTPNSDLQLVVDTSAGANIRTLANLTRANEAGTVALREQGILLPLHGFSVRESAQIKMHTKGTGASYLLNDASSAVGDTSIAADGGTGTILAGDVVTLNGDSSKYVVNTALSGGAFAIGEPGLRSAAADNAAITVGNSYRANMAFHRSAIVLAARAPALPEEGDMADDRMVVTDPRTGLSFEFAMYKQYRRVRYEVSLAWGCANIAPRHTAILLG